MNRRHELPSIEACREMYRVARDFLTANGYRQLTAYDFQKIEDDTKFVYENVSGMPNAARFGVGALAACPIFAEPTANPAAPMSTTDACRPIAPAIDSGEFPVERGFVREAADFTAAHDFPQYPGMRIDRPGYRRRFGIDVYEEHKPAWQKLFWSAGGARLRRHPSISSAMAYITLR